MYNCGHTNYQIIVMPHAHRDTAITGMLSLATGDNLQL